VRTMSALEVRRKLGAVLDLVAKRGIPVAICRSNKPLAVLVPADSYQAASSGRERRLRLTLERIGEWHKLHGRKLGKLDAVRRLRESRDAR
jgi:prevent-host-death family protein